MQQPTFIDVETGPLPLADVLDLKPEFSAPANWKDPAKIKANIEEQEAKWLADGALSAITGQVLVIGTLRDNSETFWTGESDEKQLLIDFLGWASGEIQGGRRLIGFCCKTFDWPFIVRRAWRHGLQAPFCLWDGRYWSDAIVDVAERFACGGREPRDRISLDMLSKFLGTGKKLGEGKDFAALWANDRPKALEYLKRDLDLTKLAYERLFA